MNTDIQTAAQALSSPKNIVIIPHKNPDGDAMGSTLGLMHYLAKKGHTALVITPNEYPEFLWWLPGNATVKNGKDIPQFAKDKIAEADIIFCLDFNVLNRIDQLEEPVKQSKALKFNIDHHEQPDVFDFSFHDVKASSTCQLVYQFIVALGDEALVDEAIATCLYTGIMTDTGSFRYPATTPTVHRIVANLIEAGANNNLIHRNIYDGTSESRTRLLGYCLTEKLVVLPDYATAYITLSKPELLRFNYQPGDTEGIVNFGLGIKGIKLAAIFMEKDGIVKVSLRSVGAIDVNLMARQYFNGGGHHNAAGGSNNVGIENAVELFLKAIEARKNEIIAA